MTTTYTYLDQSHKIRLDAKPDGTFSARVGDETHPVRILRNGDGSLTLEMNGERIIAHVARVGDSRFVQVKGQAYTLTREETRSNRKRQPHASGDLSAQMPGQVVDVLVQVGDTVEAGQTLLVLEAMKMEIRIGAPSAGTVQQVYVAKGAVVERGQVLVEITPRTAG